MVNGGLLLIAFRIALIHFALGEMKNTLYLHSQIFFSHNVNFMESILNLPYEKEISKPVGKGYL